MILSVSRRTDIPNYYSDWFFRRLQEGYVCVRNPMNYHQVSQIDLSPGLIDCIVFWSKNPANMIDKLEKLKDYIYYFQFTLTSYGKDIEPHLPDKRKILIPTFQQLSQVIGSDRVIWRYDPILINDRYSISYHLQAFSEMSRSLRGFTHKVIISFIDLYAKNMKSLKGMKVHAPAESEMIYLAAQLSQIAKENQMTIESCAEKIDLEPYGIDHGSCIDQTLIERLMDCELTIKKDKNQRLACGCVESIDIGSYHTCRNECCYCYANQSKERVENQVRQYSFESPLLCSSLTEADKVTVRVVKSLKSLTQIHFNDI